MDDRFRGEGWRTTEVGAACMHFLRRRPTCLAVTLGLLVVVPGTASAQSSVVDTSGPGWTRSSLPRDVNPARTVQHLVQGERVGADCQFVLQGILGRGSAGTEEDRVALNPTTCQAVYAFGPLQHQGSQPGSTVSAASGAIGPQTPAPAGDPTKAFWMKTFWEDPVGIDVTSLRNDIEWSFNTGGCNWAAKYRRNATWYGPSGWGLDWVHDKTWFNCGSTGSDATAQMSNDVFCWPNTTYNNYKWDHMVYGHSDGTAHWTWNDTATGGCVRDLSHHAQQNWESPW